MIITNIISINKLIIPEMLVAGLACFILLWDVFIPAKYKITSYLLTQLGLLFIIFNIFLNFKNLPNIAAIENLSEDSTVLFANSMVLTNSINFFKIIISSMMMIIFMYAKNYIKLKNYFCGEYFVLSLLSMLGMMILISSINFLNFYLGIELCSLPIYTLIAMENKITKLEAAIKYFILGAIFSGILLYGISLIYGSSGSIDFKEISNCVQTQPIDLVFKIGITLILISVLFKLGIVPLHMWLPDVYHGSSTVVTMLITTLPKITIVVILTRILKEVFPNFITYNWQMLLMVIALLSLIIGNVGAMLQNNIKRLLGYSAIGHSGFVLLGLAANNTLGSMAANVYIVIYSFIAIGVFGIIIIFSTSDLEFDNIYDFSALNKKHPWLSAMLLILLLSMVGLPPTVGFYAKFLILKSLIDANFTWAAISALLLTAVSLFYYLRIIKAMYFTDHTNDVTNSDYKKPVKISHSLVLVLSINGILVLGLGVFPMLLNNVLNYFKI